MESEQDIYQSYYEATPTTNDETPSVSHALEICCISYWKLVKILFIYRKLESLLDPVHCKLIWNDLRVNVFQIWWAQLKQQAARFQTFPFSANDIKFSKYLLKHVMWEGFKQSDIASMTPASRKAVLSEQYLPRVSVSGVTPPFWFARYIEKLALFISLHRLKSLPILYQLCPPQWIHVITHDVMYFLFGSLVPNGPLFRILAGTSVACPTSLLSAGQGITGHCSPKWGHLTNSPSIFESSSLLTHANRFKIQGTLLIKILGRRVGLDAERKKGWKRNSGLENLHSFNCSLLSTCYVPGIGNIAMTKMDRALLSWNSQSIEQWDKWTGHVLIWRNRCRNEGSQDIMGALRKSTTPAWGMAGKSEKALQRKWCLDWDMKDIVCIKEEGAKSVQSHVPKTKGEWEK